jgi:hypothetical protein
MRRPAEPKITAPPRCWRRRARFCSLFPERARPTCAGGETGPTGAKHTRLLAAPTAAAEALDWSGTSSGRSRSAAPPMAIHLLQKLLQTRCCSLPHRSAVRLCS